MVANGRSRSGLWSFRRRQSKPQSADKLSEESPSQKTDYDSDVIPPKGRESRSKDGTTEDQLNTPSLKDTDDEVASGDSFQNDEVSFWEVKFDADHGALTCTETRSAGITPTRNDVRNNESQENTIDQEKDVECKPVEQSEEGDKQTVSNDHSKPRSMRIFPMWSRKRSESRRVKKSNAVSRETKAIKDTASAPERRYFPVQIFVEENGVRQKISDEKKPKKVEEKVNTQKAPVNDHFEQKRCDSNKSAQRGPPHNNMEQTEDVHQAPAIDKTEQAKSDSTPEATLAEADTKIEKPESDFASESQRNPAVDSPEQTSSPFAFDTQQAAVTDISEQAKDDFTSQMLNLCCWESFHPFSLKFSKESTEVAEAVTSDTLALNEKQSEPTENCSLSEIGSNDKHDSSSGIRSNDKHDTEAESAENAESKAAEEENCQAESTSTYCQTYRNLSNLPVKIMVVGDQNVKNAAQRNESGGLSPIQASDLQTHTRSVVQPDVSDHEPARALKQEGGSKVEESNETEDETSDDEDKVNDSDEKDDDEGSVTSVFDFSGELEEVKATLPYLFSFKMVRELSRDAFFQRDDSLESTTKDSSMITDDSDNVEVGLTAEHSGRYLGREHPNMIHAAAKEAGKSQLFEI